MVADFAALRVVAVRDALPGPDVWLVLRRHVETQELKTYLCNAPIDTPSGNPCTHERDAVAHRNVF